jgi:hypothetical protein
MDDEGASLQVPSFVAGPQHAHVRTADQYAVRSSLDGALLEVYALQKDRDLLSQKVEVLERQVADLTYTANFVWVLTTAVFLPWLAALTLRLW